MAASLRRSSLFDYELPRQGKSVVAFVLYQLPFEIVEVVGEFADDLLLLAYNAEVVFKRLARGNLPRRVHAGDVVHVVLPLELHYFHLQVVEKSNHVNWLKNLIFHNSYTTIQN